MQGRKAQSRAFPGRFPLSDHGGGADFFDIATCDFKAGRGGRRTLPYAFTEHGAVNSIPLVTVDLVVPFFAKFSVHPRSTRATLGA